MAAISKATVFLRGKLYWAKVLGKPRPNYNRDGNEWTFEFEPDEDGIKELKKRKLGDRLKNKYDDRGPYIVLKKSELNRDGEPNQPIRIYDELDQDWEHDKLIGNGSRGDVKLDIRDYGAGKKSGIYPVAIRVTELVPYKSTEFGGFGGGSSEKSFGFVDREKEKEEFNKDFGLDDDLEDIL